MTYVHGTADRAGWVTNAAAAAVTLALLVAMTLNRPAPPPPLAEAPKPADMQLSLVEEPPPPPPPVQAAPPPEQEPPPLPVTQIVPSPLPPPPRPHPRRAARRPQPVPHEPVQEEVVPRLSPPSETYAHVAQQAHENHSAEAAYVSRLHALVARNTVPPHSAAYRLHHPTGEALVGFTLARDGALSNVHIIRSSGSDILDAQACLIVAGLHFPAIPSDVYPGGQSHAFSVPVAFADAGENDDL